METDEDVAKRFFERGDKNAFETLVARHAGFVFNIAFGVLKERALAEDVAQETYMRLLKTRSPLKKVGSIRPWLGRIAYNASIDTMRSSQRQRRRSSDRTVRAFFRSSSSRSFRWRS